MKKNKDNLPMENENVPPQNEVETTVEDTKTAEVDKPVEKPSKIEVDSPNDADETPKTQVDEQDVYDPMKALEEATANFTGLPPIEVDEKPKTPTSENQNDTASENETTNVDSSSKDAQNTNYQEDTSDYKIVDSPNDKPSQEETTQHKSAKARLKKNIAGNFVRQGDKAQATLAKLAFNFRAKDGLKQAEQQRDELVEKVTDGKPLSAKEQAILKYAQSFIKTHEQTKKDFSKEVYFKEDDKEQLTMLLEDYFEVNGYEPSPVFTMLMIVGVTLFSNFYTAFTVHQNYNPPT